MNQIKKNRVHTLGYNFIPKEYLPKGKDEYYLRNQQNSNGIKYRQLTAYEIEVLVRNRNTSDNWNNILVSDAFTAELVQHCKFYGLVRIGKLEPLYLEFNNLRRPVGLYNSTIISCDFGDNVVIDNVNYMSHYIVGNDVIIVNVNELAITDYAKFGNGILKEGEDESIRIWLEVCNENGGRKIIPFDGMLPGDAFLWTQFRDDKELQRKFVEFTARKFDQRRGYYGVIGDRTVIKNCFILKDVNIGSDAYIKGATKLKNVTINSNADAMSQIGEGCELVNGIMGYGCRVFYGVKAVRFVMASHSQLKYGARLINSYLGNNSTISCCEVLNALIFPAHEQHHNNSFLCAALLKGQTNIAAGATIGSNHNSRSPDGELIAGRGFWPGLCVSLKHNCRFASFTILAKGDYPAELDIPIPFSLISNDVQHDHLVVMPGYWFMYNMYALARNSWKYVDRDKRIQKRQLIEYDFLAPDTITEIAESITLLQKLTGFAYFRHSGSEREVDSEAISVGRQLLEAHDPLIDDLTICAPNFENTRRQVRLIKVSAAYHIFKELISYYATCRMIDFMQKNQLSFEQFQQALPARLQRNRWVNVGGQLIPEDEVERLIRQIHSGKIKGWPDVHGFYKKQAAEYDKKKLFHAAAALQEVQGINLKKAQPQQLESLFRQGITTKEWMVKGIYESRAKDYSNPFRKMVYESVEEMNAVVGKLENNAFIEQEMQSLTNYKNNAEKMIRMLFPKKSRQKEVIL